MQRQKPNIVAKYVALVIVVLCLACIKVHSDYLNINIISYFADPDSKQNHSYVGTKTHKFLKSAKNFTTKNENRVRLWRRVNTSITRRNTQGVVFIKLHKVGGSTLQSILYRYAKENRLSIASAQDELPKKRHVLAHHLTLQSFLQNPVVVNPVYLTLLRNPLDHACSLFYWNWKRDQFRKEKSGNFSVTHLNFLRRYSQQNRTDITDNSTQKFVNLSYTRQWEWFSASLDGALESLVKFNFTIGFKEVKSPIAN